MKQKKMLALTLSQLEQLYRHELPELVSIAVQSDDAEAFKANLTEYIAGHHVDYIMEQAKNLLAIDSPSGYGREVTEYLLKELEALGVQARRTVKGGVIADFGGRNKEDGILLEAHCDTLGGMVAQIKENGRLKLTNDKAG